MSKIGKNNPPPLVSPTIAKPGTMKPPAVKPHRP
jgi:hypothetical protein